MIHFGDEFADVKFSRAGDYELDEGERVERTFLSLPKNSRERRGLMQREVWLPGDLLIGTDRRWIWITDRDKGFCDRFGRIIRSVRRRDERAISFRRDPNESVLVLDFCNAQWIVPITAELEEAAAAFAAHL